MTLPETDVGYAQRWVKARNERLPEHVRDQVRYELEVDPRSLTVVEFRPPWDPRRMGEEWTRSPIARFRYTAARREWALYWRDQNQEFHLFPPVPPSQQIEELFDAVDTDSTGIFWG